jgi:hypothetical protein
LGGPHYIGNAPDLGHYPALNKGHVTLSRLAIYIKKYFKAKEELWKFKYLMIQKI